VTPILTGDSGDEVARQHLPQATDAISAIGWLLCHSAGSGISPR